MTSGDVKMNFKNFQSSIFFIIFLSCFCSSVFAFEVDQTILEMTPVGSNSKKTIKLKNNEKHKRVINVEVMERAFSGKNETLKATSLLVASEKSLVLEPGKESTLSIDWKGSEGLKTANAFRLILTEVKKDAEKVNQLKEPLVSYQLSVFVTPDEAKEKIEIQKSDVKDERFLSLTIRNSGKRHRLFLNSDLVIKDLKTKETLLTIKDSAVLQQLLIMPGQVKTVEIPLDMGIKKRPILVSFAENESKK